MTADSHAPDSTRALDPLDARWHQGRGPLALQIGLVTFSILALELALIRFVSGQVRVLAYFNNLILISSFLGMGVGVLLGPRRPGLIHAALPALALLLAPLAFAKPLGLMDLRFPDVSLYLWGAGAPLDSALAFATAYLAVMAVVAAVVGFFLLAGSALGHLLKLRPGLPGYSADLVGSLLGVGAMTAVTALGTPPPVWFALGALPLAWLSRRTASLASLVAIVALAQASVQGAVYSPYNRIDLERESGTLTLHVNRDFHQYMLDLSQVEGHAGRAALRRMYDLPFALGARRERALIVGAGTGNDVQAALRGGFASVVSVDIDGRIIDLGRRLHPERPYSDPRVVPVVDDARAFFERYRGPRFDVVCYGLVDSHAVFSALATLRLDNYLYTEQGLRAAWRQVADDGILTVNLSFAAGPWMLNRLYWTLAQATGTQPIVVSHGIHQAALLVACRDPGRLAWGAAEPFPRATLPEPLRRLARTTSDDWPFLYLRPGVTPWGYILVMGSLLALAFGLVRAVSGGTPGAPGFDWTLFLMGAAFLLVETRGVTSLSLLFGSTWVVNAAVFSGVLLMALAANLAVQRRAPRSPLPAFLMLFASVALLWAFDVATLSRFGPLARGLAGGMITGLPVGCAGIVVSTLLGRSADLRASLGANLLGAVLGGSLEYLSLYIGLRNLALLALALYLGALLAELRRPRAPA